MLSTHNVIIADICQKVLFTVTAAGCIVCCFYGSGQLAATLPASTKMKGIKVYICLLQGESILLHRGKNRPLHDTANSLGRYSLS